jgi:cytochrome c biogenesis protein CcmG, thiol:disulfide interchange protein DsbE
MSEVSPTSADNAATPPARRNWVRFLPLGIFAALAWFLLRGLSLDPREIPTPLKDKPAPEFRLESLEVPGKFLARKDMLGKVWMINFWGTWCTVCREEHPVLIEFARSGTIPIIGVDYKDERTAAIRWLGRLGNPYTETVFDEPGGVSIDYGVSAAPETFLIDKQGVIRFKQTGAVTPEILRDQILPLIKKLES